jgi:hypothetical protein
VYFLSKTQLKALSSPIKKLLIRLELGYPKTYFKTFSYPIYVIYPYRKPHCSSVYFTISIQYCNRLLLDDILSTDIQKELISITVSQ